MKLWHGVAFGRSFSSGATMRILRRISRQWGLALLAASLILVSFGGAKATGMWHIFSTGDVIRASEVNENFDALKASVANPQLASSSAIADSSTAGTLRFNSGQTEVATATGWAPMLQGNGIYGQFSGGAGFYFHPANEVVALGAGWVSGGLSVSGGTITIADPGVYRLSYSSSLRAETTPAEMSFHLELAGEEIGVTRRIQSFGNPDLFSTVAADVIVNVSAANSNLKLVMTDFSNQSYVIYSPSVTVERLR
jgi:hypothetical protein